MHFKLSARELEILEDRDKILSSLRESQARRTKALKPPILVVPTDQSRLVTVIERDFSFAEELNSTGDGENGHEVSEYACRVTRADRLAMQGDQSRLVTVIERDLSYSEELNSTGDGENGQEVSTYVSVLPLEN